MKITELQNSFVQSLVYDGVSGTEAARRAGYSQHSARQAAVQLLANPKVQAAIRSEQFKYLNGTLASKALKTLESVIDDVTAPHGARVQASIALLERAGINTATHKEIERLNNKPFQEMSLDDLNAFIAQGQAKLQQLEACNLE